MNKFIKRFSVYIKFCVFLGVATIGIVSISPRKVDANEMKFVVVESQNL